MSPDPIKVLGAIREATREGRFADALEHQLWFHNHALDVAPSMSAVRISSGLAAWAELARQYPPAHEELVATRNRVAASIRGGDTSFATFQELVALNQHLDDDASTGGVFLDLQAMDPVRARRYYPHAERGLVACRAYSVCGSYIPDATARFVKIRSDRRFGLSAVPRPATEEQTAGFYEAVEIYFAEGIRRLLEILTALGRVTEATQVRASALAETESTAARAMITERGPWE